MLQVCRVNRQQRGSPACPARRTTQREDLMMKGKRLLRATVLLLSPALPLAPAVGAPANASASGTEFHVVETLSCNDPAFCGNLNLIDFHGQAQFNADGSGSGQITVGAIVQGSGPATGAQHFAIDIASVNGQPGWYIGQNGDFFITNLNRSGFPRSGY